MLRDFKDKFCDFFQFKVYNRFPMTENKIERF